MEDCNRRFGRVPQNPHDAHRPLQDGEDLSHIFSWQEERTMSRNLTVHFKRVTYLVNPGPDTLSFGGKRVRVHEWDDGRVEIHAGGSSLPYSIFDQHPHVTQGAIVENKRLGAVLAVIQTAQIERDRIRLDSKKLTIRQKNRSRAARDASLSPAPSTKNGDRLGAVASFFQQFEQDPGVASFDTRVALGAVSHFPTSPVVVSPAPTFKDFPHASMRSEGPTKGTR